MAGPWENYQRENYQQPASAGPWAKYSQPAQNAAPSQEPGRWDNIKAADARYQSGEQSLPGATADIMAQGAGAINDVAMIPVKAAGKMIGKAAEYIAPDASKYVEQKASDAMQSAPVQSALEKLNQFKQAHPDLAHYVGDAAEVLAAIPAVKGAGAIMKAGEGAAGAVASKAAETTKDIAKGAGGIDINALKSHIEGLDQQLGAGYARASQIGGGITESGIQKVLNSAKEALPKPEKEGKFSSVEAGEAPMSRKAVDDMEADFKNGYNSLNHLEKTRRAFNDIRFSNAASNNDKRVAKDIVNAITKHMDPGGLTEKDFLNKGQETAQALSDARRTTAKKMSLEKLVPIIENNDTAAKRMRALKTFMKSKKNMAGFNDDEIKALNKAAKSGTADRILTAISTLAQTHGVGPAALTGLVVGSQKGAEKGVESALAVGGVGMLGRGARDALRDARFMKAYEQVMQRPVKPRVPFDPSAINTAPKEAMKLLPAPQKEFIAHSGGIIREQSAKELEDAINSRGKYAQMGMTPDVQKAAFVHEMRNKFRDIWSQVDDKTRQSLNLQIEDAWNKHRSDLRKIIEQEQPYTSTAMSQAMSNAK